MPGELIFYAGLAIVGVAVIGGLIATVLLRGILKKLNTKFDAEYGKKRR